MTTTETAAPAFAPLFDRHRALYAEWSAALARDDEDEGARLGDETNAVLEEIIAAPCASDADFITKIRYLVEAECRAMGKNRPGVMDDWHSFACAALLHFQPAEVRQ